MCSILHLIKTKDKLKLSSDYSEFRCSRGSRTFPVNPERKHPCISNRPKWDLLINTMYPFSVHFHTLLESLSLTSTLPVNLDYTTLMFVQIFHISSIIVRCCCLPLRLLIPFRFLLYLLYLEINLSLNIFVVLIMVLPYLWSSKTRVKHLVIVSIDRLFGINIYILEDLITARLRMFLPNTLSIKIMEHMWYLELAKVWSHSTFPDRTLTSSRYHLSKFGQDILYQTVR